MEKPHKSLDAWKLSMELVSRIYTTTGEFPREERYGLIDQLRRSSVSIPSNVAEGAARHTRREFINFLHMAQGSLSELDTLLEVSIRLGYISKEAGNSLGELAERVDKTLSGLIRQQKRKHQEEQTRG